MGAQVVFLTGATGFLGRHLVTQLTQAGYSIRALVRQPGQADWLRAQAEVVAGDVSDAPSLQRAMEGCHAVIHAAGLFRFWGDPAAFERTNVQGTAHVLETALRYKIKRLVHISTVVVVGKTLPETVIDETTTCQPADPYQRSKYDAENFVRMYGKATGLPAVILRPGAFYGPYGHYAFNRLFFEDPLKGLLIQVHRGQRYTFPAFVPDVARAAVAALTAGRPGEIYNVAGPSLTHQAVNETVSRLAHLPRWRLNIPEAWMLTVAQWLTRRAMRTGQEPYYPVNLAGYVFQDWKISSAKAQQELGLTATPFEDGARQTLEWYWQSGRFRRPR